MPHVTLASGLPAHLTVPPVGPGPWPGVVVIHEVFGINDDIRELILSGASAVELRSKAIENNMISLRGSGLQKIRDGVTTIEEVVRETLG